MFGLQGWFGVWLAVHHVQIIFAVPGIGGLLVDAIFGRDYPVVQGVTLVLAVLVSLVFLATDLMESWLDPRLHA